MSTVPTQHRLAAAFVSKDEQEAFQTGYALSSGRGRPDEIQVGLSREALAFALGVIDGSGCLCPLRLTRASFAAAETDEALLARRLADYAPSRIALDDGCSALYADGLGVTFFFDAFGGVVSAVTRRHAS